MFCIPVNTTNPLVVLKTETTAELPAESGKVFLPKFLLISGSNAYLDPDELIFTPRITFLQFQKLFVNSSGCFVLYQIGCYQGPHL